MTYETFDKCVLLIKAWRDRHNRYEWEWPDSRDPEFRDIMTEFKVVPQEVEKAMIALAAWRHGKDEVYQGMSAVAKVIVNRQSLGMFRTHTNDEFQFEGMAFPNDPRLSEYPPKYTDFEKLLENLDDILSGKVVDLTQGAIYFGTVNSEMDDWFAQIVTGKTRTVKIGELTFYK